MAILHPKPISLKELIWQKQYWVPLYQRPYDWGIDQISELWDDVIKNEPGYFLGTIILRPEPREDPHPNRFEIVDGQQRLATLLLLLRSAVKTLEIDDRVVAHDFQRDYIVQQSAGTKEAKTTLILSQKDRDKFDSLLSGRDFSSDRRIASWENMDNAMKFFLSKFGELRKEKGRDGIVNFLNGKILKLSFLEIHLGTDSDVYQFFETLNDRGMDLSIADLVKNRVCRKAAVANSEAVIESAITIDNISERLGPGKFKTFLLHYCWANAQEKNPPPSKKLMDWYARQIDAASDAKVFLESLEKLSLQYVNYIEPRQCRDPEKRSAFIYLDALGATRCYPLLLYAESKLSKNDFLRLCRAIEILTFRHSAVLKRDAKILEGVFYRLINEIRQEKPIERILASLKALETMKDDAQFRIALESFEPATHKMARYVLLRIEEFTSEGRQAPLAWDGLTLEHILAEKLDWAGKEEYLERLGNLTLLSSRMNRDAANWPFSKKREDIYSKEKRIKITEELLKYKEDFVSTHIISRQKDLADRAMQIWTPKLII